MDTPGIGARIRQLRGNTMTQRELADRSGVSLSLVRALEQEQRHTASINSLQRLARALDTGVATLLGTTATMPNGPDSGIVAIRAALTPVDDLIAEVVYPSEPLTAKEAHRTADYLWGAYWSGKYNLLGQLLPDALVRLRATFKSVTSAERPEVAAALARAYQAAGDTLVHLGHPDTAWLAIREALIAAKTGNDELLAAAMRVSVSWQLLVAGRYKEAEQVAMTAASEIEPAGGSELPQLTAYGTLTVTAATAAARALQPDRTAELLAVSKEVAGRVGRDRADHQTTFGPAKVAMLAVDCAVVLDRYPEALAAAKELPRDGALPLASRARHLADLSYVHTRLGNDDTALTMLLTMEQMAPDWIRYQSLPRQVVADLLQRRTPATRLRQLARRLGVVGP
ncbi:helix-turn-helix domain-containing protein [Actinosynnema sp. NPDC023587]|uniref:helix-turn-helix domain-containing protein n=1 Tax=Actinosynnema sp. NPDC023587 TaxID=3154695 RepID=UPI0034076823